MKRIKNEQGITLIVLVVTIILIMIVVGVSISSLTGRNGILTRAVEAKKLTEAKSEEEAIQLIATLSSMESNLKNSNDYYVGKKLYDKTLANGNKWNIIILNNSQKKYGTGWNYMQKGTNIDSYGVTKNNWLVNFSTGEVEKIEEGSYTELSYESGLAVTDGLVFNVDATNISDSASWGDGVKLYGVDNNEDEFYNGKALRFDGVDDYISVDGNLDVSDEITLEFYGNARGYSGIYNYISLFDAYNGIDSTTDGACMRMYLFLNKICTNFGYKSCGNNEIWENEQSTHNLAVNYEKDIFNVDTMFTATYSHKDLTYSIYKDGKLLKKAVLAKSYWEDFKNNEIPKIEYFRIGRARWNGITGYYNGLIYSVRIYNKALSSEEVLENYNKAVLYHNLE